VSRKRTINPEFWTSEQVMALSHSARLTFIGLWNFSDDFGCHPASVLRLKAELFAADDCTAEEVQGWIEELIDHHLIGTI